MRTHTFWEPLYYDLQLHPDWQRKYGAQHNGQTGDEAAIVAVQSYRERHGLLHNKDDFFWGDEKDLLTAQAFEKYIRAAYLEFVRNDPWFVVQNKYFEIFTIAGLVIAVAKRVWSSAGWLVPIFLAPVALALVVQVRRKVESLATSRPTCTAVLAFASLLLAVQAWAIVVNSNVLLDMTLFAVAMSFVMTLWAIVVAAVLLSYCTHLLSGGFWWPVQKIAEAKAERPCSHRC